MSHAVTHWFAGSDDPMMSCGAHANGEDVLADGSDNVAALWSRMGIGFAWEKKGWLWVTLIIATHK